ncbi:hypothetical protein K491DRAFT_685072 [Lophiostoma macrostomum CBS 122681]|uniref:Uncharacterized protein n=1 Tax=Lophiostoma macrostomum CBS 122681 TaxID=1314788 RepID=A0A6A6SJE0_9PLEO|nr:hypothetical protein K491DRAFT_685072 [Lophiostoma macrostomum CBS 122681]
MAAYLARGRHRPMGSVKGQNLFALFLGTIIPLDLTQHALESRKQCLATAVDTVWTGYQYFVTVNKTKVAITTYRDFRSGKFYNPWKRSPHPMLVTKKEHIAEYCEVTCLSQQALYADILGLKHTINNFEHDRLDHKVVRNRLNNRLLETHLLEHHADSARSYLTACFPNVSHSICKNDELDILW